MKTKFVWALFCLLTFHASQVVAEEKGEMIIIGDLHLCGSFGRQLVQNFSNIGFQVELYCVDPSSPQSWADGVGISGQSCKTTSTGMDSFKKCQDGAPKLSTLFTKHKDAHVLVSLGTNSLIDGRASAAYRKLAQLIGGNGSKCEWIGPPHLNAKEAKGFSKERLTTMEKNIEIFYESMSELLSLDCDIIDSREMTAIGSPGGATVDGVYRTKSAGTAWADAVTAKFKELK